MDVPAATASVTVALLREAATTGARLRAATAGAPAGDPVTVLAWHGAVLDATARLAATVAWLLARRAVETGELPADPADDRQRLLPLRDPPPPPAAASPALRAALAEAAALYARVRRLAAHGAPPAGASG